MVWYLVALGWLAIIGGVIYNYTRKQRSRASARALDMEKALVELRAEAKVRAVGASEAAPMTEPAPAPVAEFARRPRMLAQPAALLYYVFRTGLPDHEIFAGISLSDVIEVAKDVAPAQREQLRRQLEQYRLDFVICTKRFEVVAAILVEDRTAVGGDAVQFIDRCMTAAGVRLVRVDPAAPPRHHQIHALVYG